MAGVIKYVLRGSKPFIGKYVKNLWLEAFEQAVTNLIPNRDMSVFRHLVVPLKLLLFTWSSSNFVIDLVRHCYTLEC